jgi:predicted RNase H-like nuclease (RuvC/YqgF family)
MADQHGHFLDDFRREVDEEAARRPPGPPGDPLSAARRSLEEFDAWWRAENPGSDDPEPDPSEGLRVELEKALRELREIKKSCEREPREAASPPSPPEAPRQGPPLPDPAREALAGTVESLRSENGDLRRRIEETQRRMGESQEKMSRAQDGYEAAIRRLEEGGRSQQERLAGLAKDKEFLESQLTRLNERCRELEGDLDVARANGASAERENLELKSRLADLQRHAARLENEKSALDGSLRELRAHAADIQERLLRGRESLESDLSNRRKALEQVERIGSDLRRELADQKSGTEQIRDDLRKSVEEQRAQAERSLHSTAGFLETKIREIESDLTGDYEEIRGLLDGLARAITRSEPG